MDRYDRQVKIWHQWGQQRLNDAKIGVLSTHNAFLQELLKNLTLMGVHSFYWYTLTSTTFATSTKTELHDVSVANSTSSSLFYTENLLHSLNNLHPMDVHLINCSTIDELVEQSDIIVAFNVNNTNWQKYLSRKKVPIYNVFHRGMCGYIKLQLCEPHFILDPHNEHILPDLRLDIPWEGLKSLMETQFNDEDWSQLPYAIILYKLLHDPTVPTNNVEQLREALGSTYINEWNPDGIYDLNFNEAKRFAHLAFNKQKNVTFIQKLHNELLTWDKDLHFTDPYNNDINQFLHLFRSFCKDDPTNLPLHGQLPDMESSTSTYNKIVKEYNNYQTHYLQSFQQFVTNVCHDTTYNMSLIPIFIKNLRNITIMHPEPPQSRISNLYSQLLTLQKNPHASVFQDLSPHLSVKQTYPTMTYLAALTAQEMMKIITHQFIPNRLFIYDSLNPHNIESI